MSKIVKVEWEDSSSMRKVWNDTETLVNHTNQKCTSIGYLVHEDKDCVIVAGHKGEGDYAGDMRIPRKAVLKIKRLKEPK